MVILDHGSAINIGQHGESDSTSCVLSTGQIVICDTECHKGEYKLHISNSDGISTGQTVQSICEHCSELFNPYKLLPIIIGGTEYIAVSCQMCNMIRLINPIDLNQEFLVAYEGDSLEVGPMCLGQTGTLCIVSAYSGQVSLLDCTTTKFTLKRRLCKIDDLCSVYTPSVKSFQINNLMADGICYIKDHDFIVLSSWLHNRICAVRGSDGKMVWDIANQITNLAEWKPSGLAYFHDPGVLLVAGRYNGKILILSPSTGDILQTGQLPEETGLINNLQIVNSLLLVHHRPIPRAGTSMKSKLTTFSVSSRYEFIITRD